MRAATVVAILLHAVVFALLLVRLTEQPEQQPVEQPPSPVAMVFESGQKQKPSSPNPTEETKPVTAGAKVAIDARAVMVLQAGE